MARSGLVDSGGMGIRKTLGLLLAGGIFFCACGAAGAWLVFSAKDPSGESPPSAAAPTQALTAAARSCNVESGLGDNGHTLAIRSDGKVGGNLDCVEQSLPVADSVRARLAATRRSDPPQTATWEEFSVNWSLGQFGLDVIFTVDG